MNKMYAIAQDQVGGADTLSWTEIDFPLPKSEYDVLIKVHAAGLNRPDILQRDGKYAPPTDASPLLGLEVAGEVVDSRNSERWIVGDRVCALTHGGGYAEYVWVDERHCLPIPESWSDVEAASLPETFFTVWFNVFDQGRLGVVGSETLLVHAGASGIGVAAIQLAKALGNKVVVTARKDEQLAQCLSIGADAAYSLLENWEERILHEQGSVDMVLDFLGKDTFGGNLHVLSNGGRVVWLAFLTGAKVELAIPKIMSKQLTLTGSFLRPQSADIKANIASQLEETVWPLIAEGKIQPTLHSVFPIENVAKAHQTLESGGVFGKIVLTVGD